MNKPKRYLTFSTLFIVTCFLLISETKLASHPNQPDAGYADDPDPQGALTCANSGCHSGSPVADSTKFALTAGLFSAGTAAQTDVISGITTYFPDSVYYMTVTATASSPRYGFELTIIDASAAPGQMAGTLALTNTSNTSLGSYTPSGSTLRKYVGHKNAGTNKTWTFKWTAPHTAVGPVTIYYVGMNSNANGNDNGDLVYNATKVISEFVADSTTTEIINIDTKISSLNVYPTILNNDLNVSFELIKSDKVQAELVDMNGRVVSELMNKDVSAGIFERSFSVGNIAPGIYLMRLQVGNALVTKKIVKQ